MKYVLISAAIITVIVTTFSCSSPAYVQKDDTVNLSDYKTYMWVDTKSNENDQSKSNTAYADISIHNAVNAELKKMGWSEVKENPDILISYDVLVERNVELQREAVYTQSFTRSYYNPYTKKWSTLYYPSQFQGYQVYETPVKEGTITLTMVDAKTDRNVLQGWTTEKLNNAGITDDEIRRSVRNIFKELS